MMPLEWEPEPDPLPSFLAEEMGGEEETGREKAPLRDALS